METGTEDLVNRHFKNMADCRKGIRHQDKEKIHQFRVSYKKLRALLRLAFFQLTLPAIPRNLRSLYAATGRIRDLQLAEEQLRNYLIKHELPPGDLFHLFWKKKSNAIRDLRELLDKDRFKQSWKKILASSPPETPPAAATEFIRQQKNKVLFMVAAGGFTDEKIHQIRKYLKDLFYTQSFSGAEDKQLQPLLHELGIFHDHCIMLDLFDPSWQQKLRKKDRSILQGFLREEERKKNILKTELIWKLNASYAIRLLPQPEKILG